jgi:hypothetical protein
MLNSQQNNTGKYFKQDLFDINVRYYQNSFDTWDEEQLRN